MYGEIQNTATYSAAEGHQQFSHIPADLLVICFQLKNFTRISSIG
jgi:hypothetical protein